jgi:putative ABC transport system permease protein
MTYSLATLLYERSRFLPGVLAVAFSMLLIVLQCGLLLGMFSITSIPIDHSRADVWVGAPAVQSVDLGRAIPASWEAFLSLPEVERTEVFLQGFAYWQRHDGSAELCMMIGSRLERDSLGLVDKLRDRPDLLEKLTQPGAVVIDESEFDRLGVRGIGDHAEVTGRRVHVVGTVRGLKSLAGPYIFCSVETARPRLRLTPHQTMFLLARCRDRERDPARVVNELEVHKDKVLAFTAEQFSTRTRVHWLTKTKAGIALGSAAALGLLVGLVVTSQTLYAATAASMREFAVLRAMGIPRWRIGATVLAQSFWVGVAGVLLALPVAYLLAEGADLLGVQVRLVWWLVVPAMGITMLMAMVSGLAALRSLRLVEPIALLR